MLRYLVMPVLVIGAVTSTLVGTIKAHAATVTAYAPWNAVNIQGAIEEGDDLKVEDVIRGLPAARKTVTVILNSPGGDVATAARIYAALRHVQKAGWAVNTYVGKTDECASACTLIFAMGDKKFVTFGGRLMVHAATSYDRAQGLDDGNLGETDQSQVITLTMARFLKESGAPATVIAKVIDNKPEGNLLGYPELGRWGALFLSPDDGHQFATCEVSATNPEMAVTCR
jgi:hypothetical protein